MNSKIKDIKLDDLTKNAVNETKVLDEEKKKVQPLIKEQSDIDQTNCSITIKVLSCPFPELKGMVLKP